MKSFGLLVLILSIGLSIAVGQTIYIPDANLKAGLIQSFDTNSDGEIDTTEALQVYSINLQDTEVIDLTGLESFTNLHNLTIINSFDADLSGRGVRPLTPISQLSGLWNLDLVNVPVNSVSPLEGLTNLQYLNIGRYIPTDGQVTEISPLASLSNLLGLSLDNHGISDICPMSSRTALQALEFNGNQVNDISCLSALTSLVEFEFSWNPVSDISIIENMPDLYFLNVQGCQIDSISPLIANSGIGAGDYLYVGWNLLDGNDCADIAELQSRGPVELHFNPQWNGSLFCGDPGTTIYFPDENLKYGLVSLYDFSGDGEIGTNEAAQVTDLSLWDNMAVTNLEGLQYFVNAGQIYIHNRWDIYLTGVVTDLAPLAGLTDLSSLQLINFSINDLTPLQNLANLWALHVGTYVPGARISDITVVQNFPHLTFFNIDGHHAGEICSVAGATSMRQLEFNGNAVSDISCLTAMTNMVELEFSSNPIADISALGGMHQLEILVASGCQIESIAPLVTNPGIGSGDWIYVDGNLLSWDDCADIEEVESRSPAEFVFNPQQNGTVCSGEMIPEQERAALLALYASTGGDGWHDHSGWNGPDGTEGMWYGVTVRDGHVRELLLNGNNLVGALPEELGDLSYLENMRIQDNDVRGGFPASFWSLTELTAFVADNNPNFGGEILPAIGDLSELRIFSAKWAGLVGAIPDEVGHLIDLDYFMVGWNDLSGPLPASLANCSHLYALDLYQNQLTGPIPDDWRKLTELAYLSVGYFPRHSDGSWTMERQTPQGPFPSWIGELTNLKSLWLYSAGLTGEIPEGICALQDIEMLNLDFNHLNGAIPACLTQLPSMYFFSMCDNFLEGTVPVGLGDLPELEVIDLSGNLLTGGIPPDLARSETLDTLWLGRNQLSGQIPFGLGEIPNLKLLDLGDNQLTGSIPDDISLASHLQYLDLSNNDFDPGPLPWWVSDLRELRRLYLRDANRTGEISPDFGHLPNLVALDLSNNHLSGPIPESMCDFPRMAFLDISDTDIWGEIPGCFAEFGILRQIRIQRNRLSGAIPFGFSSLPHLQVLSMGGNMLSELPPDLLGLTVRDEIWLGSNALPIDDPAANAFLNAQNPDSSPFEATQTVAPVDLSVAKTAVRSVELRWIPIPYQDYSGGYEIFVASGLGFELVGSTTDKRASSILIEGLEPDTTYRFKIRTVTDPVLESANSYHLNKNTVVSAFSDVLVVTTLEGGSGTVLECSHESYDLDDNLVPPGWHLEFVRGGHLSDGKLWGQPVDGGCWMGKELDSDGHTASLNFTWDGSLATSPWGLHTGVFVTTNDGGEYTFLNVSWTQFGSHNIVRFQEPRDDGWQGSQQYYYPLENGEFSYALDLRDESAHFIGRRISDGSVSFDHTEPMEAFHLDDIEKIEFAVYATTDNANWLDNPSLTVCTEYPDEDEDGVRDGFDMCPGSAPGATVVIDWCDSGVVNHVSEDGCTVMDLVEQIAAAATNHGRFVSGVARLLSGYVDEGVFSDEDQDSIQSCAGQADIL